MRGLGGLFGPLALRDRTHDALAVRLFAAERCRYSRCFLAQRLWFGMLGLHVINGVVFDYPWATLVPDGLRGISPDGPPGLSVHMKRFQRACLPRSRAGAMGPRAVSRGLSEELCLSRVLVPLLGCSLLGLPSLFPMLLGAGFAPDLSMDGEIPAVHA